MNQSEPKELRKLHRLPTLWAAARDELNARRASQAARRRLSVEMADYATQAERNDLNALLDGYPDEEVAEIRDILNRPIAA